MAFEPTPQQKLAIDARDTSLIVSAAAGSGKTAVLTKRLTELISDKESGVRADRMVIVTFTNDAAAELKKRLDENLREELSNNRKKLDETNDNSKQTQLIEKQAYLLEQQIRLQSAKISTINSFCFEIIRDNITEGEITSGFSILDETGDNLIKAQAIDELLDYYSQEKYEDISFLYDCFCSKNVTPLKNVITFADKFLSSVPFRDKWLEQAVKEYEKPFEESIYEKNLFEVCNNNLKNVSEMADELVDMIDDIFDDHDTDDQYAKYYAMAETEKDNAVELFTKCKEHKIPTKQELDRYKTFGKKSAIKSTKKYQRDSALSQKHTERRNELKDIITQTVSLLYTVEEDYKKCAKVTKILAEVIKKFNEIVWEKKCEKNVLSFDDGERIALELLADFDKDGNVIQSEIAKKTADFYDIIMIDEYQDSNNKQDMIFKLISKNYKVDLLNNPMYGDNVFLVGDIKQSIYGFRLANPKNFINTRENSTPYSKDSNEKNQSIFLSTNFRSSKSVVEFVNYVFGIIMSKDCGDIEYNQDEQLNFGSKAFENFNNNTKTHISIIEDNETKEEEKQSKEDEDSEEGNVTEVIEESKEAQFTAQKIAEMINSGFETVGYKKNEQTGEDEQEIRPCKPSDFCILVRNNNYINVYIEELAKRGIPAVGREINGYLKSREISILIDLLRIIDNPLRDIPMVAVMTSPMYMFRIEEIAEIEALDIQEIKANKDNKNTQKKNIYNILVEICDGLHESMNDTPLAERCKSFLDSLRAFRLDSVTMTIGELINSIYDSTDFISVMQLYSDGERKRANLRKLINYAQNYESEVAYEGTGSLNGFIRHIDRILKNKKDFESGKMSAVSGDYVSIKTFHGSKGLEFPFVFITETSIGFKFDSNSAMFSDDGRAGYILYNKENVKKHRTFQQAVLAKEKEQSQRSEEMRLFYVGLTRAKQQLFINVKHKVTQNKKGEKKDNVEELVETFVQEGGIKGIVKNAKSVSEWIWAFIIANSKFNEIAEKIDVNTEDLNLSALQNNEDVFDYEICDNIEDTQKEEVKEVQSVPYDENLCNKLRELINNDYNKELTELPAKLSVTQLSHKTKINQEFDPTLKKPRFITTGSTKLTGAERGTAIHTFFQYCDFDNAEKSPAEEIKNTKEKGFISQAEADSISVRNVKAFFESSLYERIRKSDKVEREKKFMVAVSDLSYSTPVTEQFKNTDVMIKGIVDLMFEEDGEIVIVDYKSDVKVTAEILKQRYTTQLSIYKSAVELTTGKKVKEMLLYSFELKKSVKIDLI